MKKSFLTSFLAFCLFLGLQAQQPVRRLPGIINHPSVNLFAPFMSMDGNAIIFLSDNGREGEYSIFYSSRENDWTTPVELPKHVNNRLNFTRGYALSADGRKLYFTTAKSPVIGGYDILVTELKGSTWTNPENMLLPVNSKTNEGCPSLTSDGSTIYFMRCDRMTATKADACKIFKATKKTNGQWGEPEELPEHINTGNSQTPRIMADGETLIFSSDKFPGNKGGMDLYLTRYTDGQWKEPVPLDFINSARDDQYVSVNALGRYLLMESKGPRNNWELTEFLIPMPLRPKGLMKVEGTVSGGAESVSAYISVKDAMTENRVYSGRPGPDGAYFFYLKEGAIYEVAFDPEQSQKTFLVKSYDLTGEKIAQREKLNVVLKTPEPGDEIQLDWIGFDPRSSNLSAESQDHLKRLVRLIKGNPNLGFEIQVLLTGYRESELHSDPELTEQYTRVDSVSRYELISNDSLALIEDINPTDSSVWSARSGSVQNSILEETIVYHNDRTKKQAEEIVSYLVKNGIPEDQLSTMVHAVAAEGESQTTVRIRVLSLTNRQ